MAVPPRNWDPVNRRFQNQPSVPLEDRDLNDMIAWLRSEGGGVAVIEVPVLDLVMDATVEKNAAQGLPLYQITDEEDLSQFLLLGVDVEYQDSIGAKFTYEIWAGDPADGGGTSRRLAVAGQDIFLTTLYNRFTSSATAFLDNAALRDGLWLNVINRLTSPIRISAKLLFLRFPPVSDPVELPPYEDTPFAYTGGSPLSVVDVGPGQVFPEPRDALPYLAPNFVMNVHAGLYFKPIGMDTSFSDWTIRAAPGVTADDIVWNGRGGWATGYPRWTDNDSPGSGPQNPFRLWFGKGILYAQSRGTVEGIGFWYGGGAYGENIAANTGDGEAAIRMDPFLEPGAIRINRCTFDGNENSIFIGVGSNVDIHIQHCTFGRSVQNGQTPDGLTHNFYTAGPRTIVTNSHMMGANGLSAKSRSQIMTVDNSFLESYSGRAIELAEGGVLTVTNCVLVQKLGPNTQSNFIGLANENQNNGDGIGTFIGCTLGIIKYATTLNLNGATTEINFAPSYGPPSQIVWHLVGQVPDPTLEYYNGNFFGAVGIPVPADPTSPGTTQVSSLPVVPPVPAHLLPNALILDYAPPPFAGVAHTVTGKTSGYSATPTLQLSVDGGAYGALSFGSVVTLLGITIPFPAGFAQGSHTLRIRDGAGIVSNLLPIVVVEGPEIYTAGWGTAYAPAPANEALVAGGGTFTVYPAIVSPVTAPVNVDVAFGPGGPGDPPPNGFAIFVNGGNGGPTGSIFGGVSGVSAAPGLVYEVDVQLTSVATDGTAYTVWLIVTDAEGNQTTLPCGTYVASNP